MSIDLSHSNEQFIDAAVASGIFPSRSEAVNEAVELLRKREQLRAEIKIGIDELDRGEGVECSTDEVMEEVSRRLRAQE